MTVPLPRLLDPATMTETRRLYPAALSIRLTLDPVSSADMTVEMEDGALPMRSWVRLYTAQGDAGVFRVSQTDMRYDTGEQRVTLEHGLCSLGDSILGGDEEIEDTPAGWLSTILAPQPLWQAGTVEATESVSMTPNNQTLLQILQTMMRQLPGYIIATDQSVLPWTVSILRKPQTVTAEGRVTRNLVSASVSYDDAELCTRLYAPNLDGGYIDADTKDVFGVIEHYLQLSGDLDISDATAQARAYLDAHKEPSVSVELEAVDLSAATGEPLDAFAVGKLFRLAIPGVDAALEEWITAVSYRDVYGNPERVTVTLANRAADLAQRAAKTRALAESADDRSRANEATTSSIGTRVSANTAQLIVQADQISSKVSGTDYNGNTIASLINQTATTILIQASRINLQGYVTASNLAATLADLSYVEISQAAIDQITIGPTGFTFNDGSTARNVTWQSQTVVTGGTNHQQSNIAMANASGLMGFITLNYLRASDLSTKTIYYLGRS